MAGVRRVQERRAARLAARKAADAAYARLRAAAPTSNVAYAHGHAKAWAAPLRADDTYADIRGLASR